MVDLDESRQPQVALISSSGEDSKMTLRAVPDQPGVAARILHPVAEADIMVDVIVQNVSSEGLTDFTFTVESRRADQTEELLRKVATELKAGGMERNDDIAKITLTGNAMLKSSGIASRAFSALADVGVNISMITTSDIKITMVVAHDDEQLAVRQLHRTFFPNTA